MCRHIYDWNIVNCDVKQTTQLNSTLLRAPTGEERVLIKIEFNRVTIMFKLLRASIELVRTNCAAHIFNQGAQ